MNAETNGQRPPAEAIDPIASLIDRLAAAADSGAALALGCRARVTIRRGPAGFAVERDQSR